MKNLSFKLFLALNLMFVSAFISCKQENKTVENEIKGGLRHLADFPIGTAINIESLSKDTKLQELLIKNFNSITSASDMKMNRVMPEDGKYYWDRVDSIANYAKQHNHRLFGHNLIWHSSTPKWVVQKAKEDSLWLGAFMKDYISTYVGRYRGRVKAWDVVNEGFETKGGAYRETMWYKALGKEYIAKAFKYAHEADPDAILFYNDFNIERDTVKLNATLKMVKELRNQGVPISGIGFQMHIRMDIPDETIEYALSKAVQTGLQIHLSEVDVIFNKHDDTRGGGVQIYNELTDEMKLKQKGKYKNLVKMYRRVVPEPQQYGITFWDFTDRDSWIRGFFNMNDWPTIYDDNLKAKPAYFGVLEGLIEDPKIKQK